MSRGQNYGSLPERAFHGSAFFSFSLENDMGLPKNQKMIPLRCIYHTWWQNDTPQSVRNLKNDTSLGHVTNLGKRWGVPNLKWTQPRHTILTPAHMFLIHFFLAKPFAYCMCFLLGVNSKLHSLWQNMVFKFQMAACNNWALAETLISTFVERPYGSPIEFLKHTVLVIQLGDLEETSGVRV